MSNHSVSVIIPAYNCEKTIRKTIQAVISQDVLTQVEIIVVDDGSSDGTAQVIRSFPQVKYVHQENSGPAAARNCGAQKSTGEYLFFTDSDCVPQKDWIKKMLPHFQDPAVAVVAGSYGIANPENDLAACIHKEILYRHTRMPRYPSYFGSFNFAVRRENFILVKGFDALYRNASGEDNDLSYKIISRGGKIYFTKDALVDHFHTESIGKYLREQYRHGFWRAKMYLQHPAMSRGDDYTFWKDIGEIPAVLLVLFLFGLSFGNSLFISPAFGVIGGLALLEICYGLVMMKNVGRGLFWAYVMAVRTVFRSFGFIAGIVKFLPQKALSRKI